MKTILLREEGCHTFTKALKLSAPMKRVISLVASLKGSKDRFIG